MCAPIGRSQHRAIIVLCFARIAARTDTRPVRAAEYPPLRCDSVASTPYGVTIIMRVAHRREYTPRLATNGYRFNVEHFQD